MNQIEHMMNEFEGNNVSTITYKGRPCWLVKEIGEVLGYPPQGLVKRILDEWANEVEDGVEIAKLSGKELDEFRSVYNGLHVAIPGNGTAKLSPKARSITLLYEPGLYLVLAKTNKPKGRRFRKFISREVMPQVARDGHYIPGRSVGGDGSLTDKDEALMARERRLSAREDRLDRQMKKEAMKDLLVNLKRRGMPQDIIDAYEVTVAEVATGSDLSDLKPKHVEDEWMSPTQISKAIGRPVAWVGRAITQLKIRGNLPGLCKPIVNKAKGHSKTVTSYVYSQESVGRIQGWFEKRFERKDARAGRKGGQLSLPDPRVAG